MKTRNASEFAVDDEIPNYTLIPSSHEVPVLEGTLHYITNILTLPLLTIWLSPLSTIQNCFNNIIYNLSTKVCEFELNYIFTCFRLAEDS